MADQDISSTEELTSPTKENDEIVTPSGCGATAACDPRRRYHRYIVLCFMCFLSFGGYFCYDNPGALQKQMKRDLDLSTQQFMYFYSFYSWPNVVLCFFGGFLVDKVFGVRLGATIFCLFIVLGQVLFGIGAIIDKFWFMVAARFIYGIGGESIAVAQNTYAVYWFEGAELNMAFGIQLCVSRVGSTVNMNVMGPLYNALSDKWGTGYKTLGYALLVAGLFCCYSLLCSLIVAAFDRRAERILGRKHKDPDEEKIRFTDIKDFPLSLWLIFIICVAYYGAVQPFVSLGLVFFEEKYGADQGRAQLLNSIVNLIGAVACPFMGILIDWTGRKIWWVIAAILLGMCSHAMLAFTFWEPFVPVVLMGISYSMLACSLWPMVPYVMPRNQTATAYGLMQAFQNLGLAIIAILAGKIVDALGFFVLEVFFLGWLCIALILAVIMYVINEATGGKMNLSRSQYMKQNEEEDLG